MIGAYQTAMDYNTRARTAVSLYHEGQRGRGMIVAGAAGIHRETRSSRWHDAHPTTIVGGALFHTVGDRNDVIKKLGTEFALLEGDMARALGWTQDHPVMDERDPRFAWWQQTAVPILNEWQDFQADKRGSWFERFALSWDVIESWQERLIALRQAARAEGFGLASPEPTALPRTIWDSLFAGLGEAWSLLKSIVFWGLLGGGIWLLWGVYKSARGL